MKQKLSLPQIKQLQLNILHEIHSFCKTNKIKYSLAYGSLLGAIRHQGYIPWDDDIDIWMPREDYLKFMSSFRSTRYKQIFKFENSMILLPYGKVYDSDTLLIENVNYSISNGVFVDIFPLDKKPQSNYRNLKMSMKRLFQIKRIKEIRISNTRALTRNLLLILLKVVTFPIRYKTIIKSINSKLPITLYEEDAGLVDYNEYDKELVFNRDSFDSLIEVRFENQYFLAISNYDEILRLCYGDYMTLPPKEMQITHHDYIAYLK